MHRVSGSRRRHASYKGSRRVLEYRGLNNSNRVLGPLYYYNYNKEPPK